MTDPSPTRAEGLTAIELLMLHAEHGTSLPDMDDLNEEVKALRERAEAAEAERSEQWRQRREAEAARDTALAISDAARRAEAAAWNDAIEAAGNLESIHGYSNAVPRHRIRALRRAAPTEGEA